jgi:hypothetical protein
MRALAQVRVALKIALAVAAVGAVAAAAPAVAAGRSYPSRATRPAGLTAGHKPPPTSLLKAVAAASRTNAWAVGEFFNGPTQTLIEH